MLSAGKVGFMTGPYPQAPYQPAPQFQQPPKGGNRGLVIALVSIAGVLALVCVAGIAGAVWYTVRGDDEETRTDAISGLIDYRATHPEWLGRDHKPADEKIEYPMTPAAGGPHHQVWQRCSGDVYTTPIDEGNAVHSLEHGAVWITYQVGLPAAEVEKLAARVRSNDYMMMSPYEGQSTPISLQAWGYQLQVSSAGDDRIARFVDAYRKQASMEPGASCSGGTASTDLSPAPSATG